MNSSIDAEVTFDFQGIRHTPTVTVNLHRMMSRQHPDDSLYIYDLLAASIGMDQYRHEYDVMLMHPIRFSNPVGLACDFIQGTAFDFEGFADRWEQQQALHQVEPIAKSIMSISNLEQHPELRDALIACYRKGQNSRKSLRNL